MWYKDRKVHLKYCISQCFYRCPFKSYNVNVSIKESENLIQTELSNCNYVIKI